MRCNWEKWWTLPGAPHSRDYDGLNKRKEQSRDQKSLKNQDRKAEGIDPTSQLIVLSEYEPKTRVSSGRRKNREGKFQEKTMRPAETERKSRER